jgi:plastocyanin
LCYVLIRKRISRGNRLVADPPQLSIVQGDFVLWHSHIAATPAYVIQGEGEGEAEAGSFDSTALTSETLYTHAFGVPGDYEWSDAYCQAVRGVVKVALPPEPEDRTQGRRMMEALTQGTVVTIEGDRSDPSEVSILVGQTVFFAVAAADGITITDSRLLG